MKKYLILLILCSASLVTFLFNGCKKDKGSDNYLRGKIDGVDFSCHLDIGATPSGSGDKIIAFRGGWGVGFAIHFYLDGQGSDITEGSYEFQTGKIYHAILYENNEGFAAGYFCDIFSPCELKGSGNITIHGINNKHVRGTFEFVTSDLSRPAKTITGGEFYISR